MAVLQKFAEWCWIAVPQRGASGFTRVLTVSIRNEKDAENVSGVLLCCRDGDAVTAFWVPYLFGYDGKESRRDPRINGSAARFDDLGLYLFATKEEAEAFVAVVA